MTKSLTLIAALAAGLTVGLTSSTAVLAQSKGTVNVYNWSDYIDEELLSKFEDETGYKLVYDVFDSNEVLETKLLAGGSGYDVVVPSAEFLQRQIQAGAFQQLDMSKIPNAGGLWDVVSSRTAQYDPGNAYSVNYMWGTTGLGTNVGKITEILGEDAPLNSMELIFNPDNMAKLADCGVYFLDAPAEVIRAALTYLGEDPDTTDAKTIQKAESVLMAVRPYVKKFHSSEYITALANGDICAAIGWSGDVLQARDRAAEADNGVEVAYNAFVEGSQMWFDQMAIPADASNVEGAHAFINFIIQPENMAAASNYVYYANGVLDSQPLLLEDVIGDTAIYPDAETLSTLYTTSPWDPKNQRIATRLWTKVTTGN
ncbi:MAG: polyamine ABC transporter substrate-binding protein [Pseudomonadota bacterium]